MDTTKQRLIDLLTRNLTVEVDPVDGEVLIRTGLYQWKDQSWRDGPDPALDLEWPVE